MWNAAQRRDEVCAALLDYAAVEEYTPPRRSSLPAASSAADVVAISRRQALLTK